MLLLIHGASRCTPSFQSYSVRELGPRGKRVFILPQHQHCASSEGGVEGWEHHAAPVRIESSTLFFADALSNKLCAAGQ